MLLSGGRGETGEKERREGSSNKGGHSEGSGGGGEGAAGAPAEDRPSLPLPPSEQYSALLEERVSIISDQFSKFLQRPTLSPEKERVTQPNHAHASETPQHPPSTSTAADVQSISIEVFTSPPRHFRARCRFAVLEDPSDGKLHYFLYEGGAPSLLADDFPAACLGAYRLMPRVMEEVNADEELKRGIKAVHFLTTRRGHECLVTLIYELPLSESWRASARKLAERCEEQAIREVEQEGKSAGENEGETRVKEVRGGQTKLKVSVMGRSKGVVLLEGSDVVTEELTVRGKTLCYQQVEGSFSNPNPFVNEKCLEWLSSCADQITAAGGRGGDGAGGGEVGGGGGGREESHLLELYCGNGNHTCALASRFAKVVAVEINQELCKAAEFNLSANSRTNASILCSPSHRFCLRLLGGYTKDTAHTGKETKSNGLVTSFETVLVDPPRAGLDSETCRLVALYRHVMYISCNPAALARDLELLNATHSVERFAVFDHFPYTKHIECGVLLRRRTA